MNKNRIPKNHYEFWGLTRNEKLGLELFNLLNTLKMNPNYKLNDDEQELLEEVIDETKFAIIPIDLIKKHSSLDIDKEKEISTITLTFKVEAKSCFVEESEELEMSLEEHLLQELLDSISILIV